ncbi:hypothetical protein ASE63_25940 [Bosea sp. Root381]|nr:hypothetical protein ASE63_25940 [Bosea sp. Root381]
MAGGRVSVIRYEDMLSDADETIRSATALLPEILIRPDRITLPESPMRRMGEVVFEQPFEDGLFETDWYRQRRYLQNFAKEQIEFIDLEAEPSIMSRLGYGSAIASRDQAADEPGTSETSR